MAVKKKSKTKTKKKKKASPATRKAAVARKSAPKKKSAAKKKTKSVRAKPAARKPAPMPAAPAPVAPPGMERVGIVTHYYNHLSVAIVQLDAGGLRVGETIHIRGHTSDFSQPVESMEVDHVHVNEARPGQSFGLRVKEHAREHDIVYKAKP